MRADRGDIKEPDATRSKRDNRRMADDKVTEREYHDAFRERLVALRESLGWKQPQMAKALGISLDSLKKYETVYKFPPHLYEQLALVTHREIEYIVTGRNVRQLRQRHVS